jgi:membrane protease YdiL (CAAX protease family)
MRAPDVMTAEIALPRVRLWTEFLLLFAGVPIAMAAFFGLYPLFPVLIGFSAVALLLLVFTPGFSAREFLHNPIPAQWPLILVFTLGNAVLAFGLAYALVPERLMELPQHRPSLWLMIMLLYPLLSALPQELIYRSLFFRRYGGLFPNKGIALAANSGAFALAHLFYLNHVAIALTLVGGAVFGWAYLRHGSLMLAVLLHTVAGQLIFTSGLGVYFYHGAIGSTP